MKVVLVLSAVFFTLTTANSHDYYSNDEYGYMSDWNSDWAMLSGRLVQQPKCIDIPANLSLCHGIGYTQMRLPNLLEHETITEVTQQSGSWQSLVNIHCHPDTKLFLCSLFSPVCLDRPIWPCRTLCEGVKAGCESKMLQYGFPWPEMFKCDKFPLDNDLCISLQNEKKPDESVCEPCNQPDTFEAIVDSYCRSSFTMKMTLEDHLINGNDIKITRQKKRKLLKKTDLKKRDLRTNYLYVQQGATCECNVLSQAERGQQLLVMGNKVGDRLVLNHIQNYDKRSQSIRKALRAIRKSDGNICEDIHVIAAPGGESNGGGSDVISDRKRDENNGGRDRGDRRSDRKRGDRKNGGRREKDRGRDRKDRKKLDKHEERGRKRDQSILDNNGGRRSRKNRERRNRNGDNNNRGH